MGRITDRIESYGGLGSLMSRLPASVGVATLLAGAIAFGASAAYSYNQLTSVAYAEGCEAGDLCDDDNDDDCGTNGACYCYDAGGTCKKNAN